MAQAETKAVETTSDFEKRKEEFNTELLALQEKYKLKLIPYMNPTLIVQDLTPKEADEGEEKTAD